MNSNRQSAAEKRSARTGGVSVVVCSYNGALRLPRVLDHLARQQAPDLNWEVIVVDNASTDGTGEIARRCWPECHPAPLRVVSEPRQGLAFAKQRGIAEARYELIGFIDDDSWVDSGWVGAAMQACVEHPQAGAIRGVIEVECENAPPRWFASQRGWFGVCPEFMQAADITEMPGVLCGDGMVLRAAAWQDLVSRGFQFTQTGNQGGVMNGSEDEELSLALRLAGWRLWYDPRLRLKQFLPPDKLCWEHLRRRARNAGVSSVGLDAYYAALRRLERRRPAAAALIDALPAQWLWRALWSLKDLMRRPLTLMLMAFSGMEGNDQVLAAESALSRVGGLLKARGAYDLQLRRARRMCWR